MLKIEINWSHTLSLSLLVASKQHNTYMLLLSNNNREDTSEDI